jgi:hypothetical protein
VSDWINKLTTPSDPPSSSPPFLATLSQAFHFIPPTVARLAQPVGFSKLQPWLRTSRKLVGITYSRSTYCRKRRYTSYLDPSDRSLPVNLRGLPYTHHVPISLCHSFLRLFLMMHLITHKFVTTIRRAFMFSVYIFGPSLAKHFYARQYENLALGQRFNQVCIYDKH